MQEILLFLQRHWPLATVAIIILIALTLVEFIKIRKGNNRLSPVKATQLINHENAAIIDIRPADAFANGHIIGAISLPIKELDDKIKKIERFKTQPIIVVCATGAESSQATTALAKKGFPRVYILDGGIRAWKVADMPLVKGG